MAASLAVSVVTFAPDLAVLERVLASLAASLDEAYRAGKLASARVALVDNGPGDEWSPRLAGLLRALPPRPYLTAAVLSGHGNVGYGRANNLALLEAGVDCVLVLNPDVIVDASAMTRALAFLDAHPDVGLLAPMARGEDGERQYLCKRMPSVLSLGLRGFAPGFVKRRFAGRLAHYEMRELSDAVPAFDIPIVSGCFMLFRAELFQKLGGFDPQFFMYFEDFDLSLRAGKLARVAFVPQVQVTHFGGHASRKGWRHVRMFVRSAGRFFGKHGWHWF